MIDVGILTPHAAAEAGDEFCVTAGKDIRTRVRVEPDEVVEWVAEKVPGDVDAVFLGGNGFRAARAVGLLEQRLDRPVLESNQVLLWPVNESLGNPLDVRGFGRLLEPGREDAS